MPTVPPIIRASGTGLRRMVTAVAVAATLCATGCQDIGTAARMVDGSHLVNTLATRLDRSAELTYSADYRVAGGSTATLAQAQRPQRAAYSFPGGKVTVTVRDTAVCRTPPRKATCVLALSTGDRDPSATALTAAPDAPAMVAAATVVDLLIATARDANAHLDQHDTTVAGRHATCVGARATDNPSVTRFVACITTEGVLGSFTGTVNGQPVDIAMTRYRDDVDPAEFDLPHGAKVVHNPRPAAG
ncbi:MAG TPA: hypothetical protein VF755_25625 [Catenuloplanes sp.]